MKRQQWTCGAIVIIPLGGGYHSYAQMLESPEVAFFDCRTKADLSVEAVVACPVLFRLWVNRYAITTGRWQKVGLADVAPALQREVPRYIQDSIRPQDIRLYLDAQTGPLVSVADCEGLECAAVWEPEHVEDRLRDHDAGVPNDWVLSMRPKVVTPEPAGNAATPKSRSGAVKRRKRGRGK